MAIKNMKSFLQLVEETSKTHKPVVMAFGRYNPPTTGHLKLIDKVREVADKHHAPHTVIVSHSQSAKKDPLTSMQKLKHLKRYSPGTNFDASSKDHPSIFHHAAKLHAAGHDHLIVVAGSDRVKEFHDVLHRYNGVEGRHGHYNFKKITVVSAGHRDPDAEGAEGMSGTKMREHAKNNDFSSFRQGVPSHVSDYHAKELMKDTRKGMGINENVDYGKLSAIFVTGGPGSGKDIVIRESIACSNITELNHVQAINYLADKQKLTEETTDNKLNAIRNRNSLVINGPADDLDKIAYIKEELEELGYNTMMVFVNTTNEVSQERNKRLSKVLAEGVRFDKWSRTQNNVNSYVDMFEEFVLFDNSGDEELKEQGITEAYQITKSFLESASSCNRHKLLKDNNCPSCQIARKAGKIDDVRDGDIKSNPGSYTFRTYESSTPTLKWSAVPREPKFQMDNDKDKRLKKGDTSNRYGRIGKPDGIGSTFSTRTSGQGLTGGAGLGNPLSSESVEYSNAQPSSSAMPGSSALQPNPLGEKKKFDKFRKSMKKEAIDDPGASDMGVAGVLGGASNKEGMDTYKDANRNIGIIIKKKKGKSNV